MSTIEVNGVELFYEVVGDGPPMLVLHGGLGVDQTIYRNTLQPFAEHHQVVFYDHRGNGRSGRPPVETITIEQLADDATALAGALGFDRFDVFGHSFGGFIAQELALRHAARVEHLLLVATTPGQLGTDEYEATYAGEPPPPEFLAAVSSMPATDAEHGSKMVSLLPFYVHQQEKVADAARAIEGTVYSASAMVQGFVSLSRWSAVDRLGTLRCPTLIIGARNDVLTGWRQQHRIGDRIPGAEVVVLEDAGHFLWIEQPERFFPLVRAFLA